MPMYESTIGGTQGAKFRVRFNLDVVAQEEDNNRSLVQISSYVDNVSYSGSAIWNSTGNTTSSTNRNGSVYNANGWHYSSGSPGRVVTFLSGNQFWVGHDGNGNGSCYARLDANMGNSPYLTSGWVETTMGLPSLYQEIGFNSITFSEITDVSFKIRVVTNRTANLLQLNVDGGGLVTYYSGNYSDVTVQVGSPSSPLASGVNHTVVVRTRRASNNNVTDSGTQNVSTLSQNQFFDIGDF